MDFQTLQKEFDYEQLVRIRRTLHQIPQIGLKQYQTSKLVRKYLQQLQGIQILQAHPKIPTAIIAKLLIPKPCHTYLFRCQLDALPWPQLSNQPFSSITSLHHACGHDAHISILLLACKHLSLKKSLLKNSIIFCFQPGQEGKGGAKMLLDCYEDLLMGVEFCFALHGGNHFGAGNAIVGEGNVSANISRFSIRVKGKGCHVMLPESAIDANYIGCNLVNQLYTLKQLKIKPLDTGTISVTKVEGGTGPAMISEDFLIEGSLRMISLETQNKMKKQIQKLAINYCQAFGAQAKVNFIESHYRSVFNDKTAVNKVKTVLKNIFPPEYIKDQVPSFNGQDFCQFSQKVPSCYFVLGAGIKDSFNQNGQSIYPLHSNKHRLDQKFMLVGLKIWVQLALYDQK